jgi:ribulose-5-phosphate 4-epimerase/fuculose-1-phosphate aldolase
MPRDVGGPLVRLPLAASPSDGAEVALHKAIYAASDFQTVMHCHVAEAEAAAHYVYPGESAPADRIVPVDAEGSFLYLVIPVLPPDVTAGELVRRLHDYKVAVVRGGGVWAVGSQSLSEVLHHPSSLREICLYRIGAVERGLDLRRMEPPKAQRW